MDFRSLGGSGLKVPVLTLGTGTFGGSTELFKSWGTTDVAEATRLVDICLDAGLTMFDSADVYSQGRAEEILGQAIKGRRDKVLISTKGTFKMGPGPNDQELVAASPNEHDSAALKRLGTDYIDLYTNHGFDAQTPVEETLRTLDDFVRAGKLRYLGVSNFSGWHLMKSLAASDRYGYMAPRRTSGVLLARGPRLRVGADAARARSEGRRRRLESARLGPAHGQDSPRFAARRGDPAYREAQLRHRPAGAGGVPVQGRRRSRRGRQGDRQDGAADRPQLAGAAAVGVDGDHRRPQRAAAPAEHRRRRLVADTGPDDEARRRERGDAGVSVLAPARVQGAQPVAGVFDS